MFARIAALIVVVVACGIGAAAYFATQQDNSRPSAAGGNAQTSATGTANTTPAATTKAQSGSSAPNPQTTETLPASSPSARNPLVNPSAAGTQTRYRGYAPSSGAVANSSLGGEGERRGGSQLEQQDQPMAPASPITSPRDARNRLEQLGFSRITGISRDRDGGWLARARRGRRHVMVELDNQGNVVSER